jgi:hypothetical protein
MAEAEAHRLRMPEAEPETHFAHTIVVDFNNIALFDKGSIAGAKWSIASAGCYRKVEGARQSVCEWLGLGPVREIIYSDPDVETKRKGWDAYEKREIRAAEEGEEFFIAPKGTKADPFILSEAETANGLIVSNDRYLNEVPKWGHEWLLFESRRLIAPVSVSGTHWTWRWIEPAEQIAGFYGKLSFKGPSIDIDYLRAVERETGYDFRRPKWVSGEPFGIHHLARELGAKVASVRWALRQLGYSDYLGVALSEDESCHVRKFFREQRTSNK